MEAIKTDTVMASRAYQLEMFEASLKENVIVVMDTGSGKTHVAVLRIRYELEHAHEQKLVWFLAPTVSLCNQQYEVIRASIPSVSVRLVVGSDNVEHWKSQEIWDKVLWSRVIVSTPAILSDALNHGFVHIQRLGLLVFDEAHHCSKNHPACRIMKDHYFPFWSKQRSRDDLPRVLGLTASPIKSSKVNPDSLRQLEQNLDAICRSPRIHRSELLKHVYIPQLDRIIFNSSIQQRISASLRNLQHTIGACPIHQLPSVLSFPNNPAQEARMCATAMRWGNRCREALQTFLRKVQHVQEQLGAWPAEVYFAMAVERLEEACKMREDLMFGWEKGEKSYILNVLQGIPRPHLSDIPDENDLSPKLVQLIKFLNVTKESKFSAIIFVEQRATAYILSRVLNSHISTRSLSTSSFVGTSNSSKRRTEIGDLVDMALQANVLDEFKIGQCDIVVATSVLEEGVDISSCNLVICFDKPPVMKSFIQRRGRARDQQSTFIMMMQDDDSLAKAETWKSLEQEMIKLYTADRCMIELNVSQEAAKEHDRRRFVNPKTGAVLTADIAMEALNHFCGRLPRTEYVDNRLVFRFVENSDLVQAEVILPISVDASVRRCCGQYWWRTDRHAMKDAAYHAYISLYHAGLVNDNFVPTPRLPPKLYFGIKHVPSRQDASEVLDPWKIHAYNQPKQPESKMKLMKIDIERFGKTDLQMFLLCPNALHHAIPPCTLHWTKVEVWKASFMEIDAVYSPAELELARTANELLLRSLHSSRMLGGRKNVVPIFFPFYGLDTLREWLNCEDGFILPRAALLKGPPYGIVRHPSLGFSPRIFQSWVEEDGIEITSFPRRRNFLRPSQDQKSRISQLSGLVRRPKPISDLQTPLLKTKVISACEATFDNLSEDSVVLARLIPSLTHHLGSILVAMQLCETILPSVGFHNIEIVKEALSASSAGEILDYQRLELIGDTVLKFITAVQLFTSYPSWHEGYLSKAKDSLVANGTLSSAATAKELDKFIITAQFSPRKWRPKYEDNQESEKPSKRMLSTKILADVVEALIGAAYVEGGFHQAAACAHVFVEEIKVASPTQTLSASIVPPKLGDQRLPKNFKNLEELLGYHFCTPHLLVEAMTHPSAILSSLEFSIGSYQRLEFLGDAVLEMLLIENLAARRRTLSHVDMHLLKDALVNSHLLAFLCMCLRFEEGFSEIRADGTAISRLKQIPLCNFMRFEGLDVARAQETSLSRYRQFKDEINEALSHGSKYPRSLLLRINAPKFISDLVESVLGAIFVDSQGDLAPCRQFAEKLGLLPYLERILRDSVDILHPKSRLGELARAKSKYVISREELPKSGYRCHVEIHGIRYPEVDSGVSKEEITTRASEAAIEVISMELASE